MVRINRKGSDSSGDSFEMEDFGAKKGPGFQLDDKTQETIHELVKENASRFWDKNQKQATNEKANRIMDITYSLVEGNMQPEKKKAIVDAVADFALEALSDSKADRQTAAAISNIANSLKRMCR